MMPSATLIWVSGYSSRRTRRQAFSGTFRSTLGLPTSSPLEFLSNSVVMGNERPYTSAELKAALRRFAWNCILALIIGTLLGLLATSSWASP